MSEARPFDLYDFVHRLVQADWIEQIHIFGSRRYLSNASYGSDIDLLVTPNKQVPTDELRKAVDHPYVDAFLFDSGVAISARNETRIRVGVKGIDDSVDAVQIWTRADGWKIGNDYRILNILPDRNPAMTIIGIDAQPTIMFCALESEFAAAVNRLPMGKQTSHSSLPTHYAAHLNCKAGRKRLVAVVQTGVASVRAGAAATRIFDYFDQPMLAILFGITAGLKKQGTALGDVLVPICAVDVESGKVTPKGKEPAGVDSPTTPYLHDAIASWPGRAAWSARWRDQRPNGSDVSKLIPDCTIACTSSVIAYGKYARKYRKYHRKIMGIEMEAVGIGLAAMNMHCPYVIVKSISDWANKTKDNTWHQYCMDSVADLVISMLEDGTL